MIYVEKKVGSELAKIPNQENRRQEDSVGGEQSLQSEYNEINDLINTMILPVMIGCKNQLRLKSIKADILRGPIPGNEQIDPPSIKFTLHEVDKKTERGVFPNIKFTTDGDNILVEVGTTIYSPSIDRYPKNDMNKEFVESKLTDLIKSCFDIKD
jgi:hypothetical protein